MKLEDVRLLSTVVRHGSISAAARKEKASIATIARRIVALEAELGVLLMHRNRDGVRATSEGLALINASAKAEEAMQEMTRVAKSLKSHATNAPVVISATEPVISDVLAPQLGAFWRDHPGVGLELRSSTEVVSLSAGDAQIALRFAKPEGESLTVRRIATFRLGLFASSTYLGRRASTGIDLRAERLLGYDDSYGPIQEVAWFVEAGLSERLALRTSSTRALLSAARAGVGIAILPAYFALTDALIEIAAPRPIAPRPVWMMSHKDATRTPRIQAVREWIVSVFASIR